MKSRRLFLICLALLMLTGCTQKSAAVESPMEATATKESEPIATESVAAETLPEEEVFTDYVEMEISDQEYELVEEAPEAAIPDILEPVASGELVEENDRAKVDYSHTEDGYVMVCYTAATEQRLKVQVMGPTTTYTYNLTPEEWAVLPLSDGNGGYQVKVYQNVSGNQYSLALGAQMNVNMIDEFAPFLRPNQYVNYAASSVAVAKAYELTKTVEDPLLKVEAIYNFAVAELTYDYERAATVKSGYIPVLDSVLEEKKGICFDYAALMTGMLRSQGIPCKMVFGYASGGYHAWISVWMEDSGWVDGAIFFDGIAWKRLDPTFASTENQSESIMEYINNNNNYREKYFY